MSMKGYNANYRIHAPLEATMTLLHENRIAFEDIDKIDVGVSSATMTSVGAIIEPTDQLGAQFSIRFALALAAKHGHAALDSVGTARLTDPDVLDLAHRVDLHVDREQEDAIWRSLGAVVSITTLDGNSVLAPYRYPRGSHDRPFDDRAVQDKFTRLAVPVLGDESAARVIDTVSDLQGARVLSDLIPNLVAVQRRAHG